MRPDNHLTLEVQAAEEEEAEDSSTFLLSLGLASQKGWTVFCRSNLPKYGKRFRNASLAASYGSQQRDTVVNVTTHTRVCVLVSAFSGFTA